MRRLRNAKIVATLGPASSTHDVISALFQAGVDVFGSFHVTDNFHITGSLSGTRASLLLNLAPRGTVGHIPLPLVGIGKADLAGVAEGGSGLQIRFAEVVHFAIGPGEAASSPDDV